MKRPEHATDCPACDGWIGGAELLCVRCTDRVQQCWPELYPTWLFHRSKNSEALAMAMEHYYRGLIVGTAIALNAKPAGKSARAPLRKGAAS